MNTDQQRIFKVIKAYLYYAINDGNVSVYTKTRNDRLMVCIDYGNKTINLPFDDSSVDYASGFADAYNTFVLK